MHVVFDGEFAGMECERAPAASRLSGTSPGAMSAIGGFLVAVQVGPGTPTRLVTVTPAQWTLMTGHAALLEASYLRTVDPRIPTRAAASTGHAPPTLRRKP